MTHTYSYNSEYRKRVEKRYLNKLVIFNILYLHKSQKGEIKEGIKSEEKFV